MKQVKDIELEYKFEIENKKTVEKILDSIARRKLNRQFQSNTMFDNPQKLMQSTDGRVRVRTLGKTGKKVLTFKRPMPPENTIKKEIEYEINFEDKGKQVEMILSEMNFNPSSSYERFQTKWQIGEVSITLDEYPFAMLLEIEGNKNEIEKIAKKLGFETSDGLTSPVDTLFQKWRKERGLSLKPHMKFDDFDK